ncbi:erbin isoform X1 [Xiphophorus couchianus]|uniref:erbin isoform X1 n=1 Tax=Xiphophorus couchianus TaxID=32473 RepID=UPI001016707D|nr:erbin isoform X1 [Xiphophorus couchianus]XP_027880695.1 erbin isoform X1 [Xiphophorus couchianus]
MSKRSFFVRLVPCRCLRGEEEVVTSLDYSHCSLETVPKEIFGFEKTLQELYLDANQIEELPKQLFNCQFLNRLSMPDNDVTVLPAAIANLVNLRELDVSKNSIQEFPENIKNCKILTVVEASVNPISKLPEGFTQLMSLTQLYLNDAFLEFLPASFGRLTKLQILELRENQLKMLPKSMQKLTQLERLDLGSNEFTEVPEVLENLNGLKELWMDGNKLTFLPGMLGMLKQLVYLDVSKNNLEMVDEKLSGCENLQDLLLSNNTLTQLPGSIGSFKKLTTLKVDENQLMYLPDSIGGLTSIDELDCSFNEIEALPASIGQCVSIRTFAADHNFLSQLPPELGSWKSATVLFLHSNKLESLPEEMGDMQKLKVINLSNNKLKNLPYSFTKLNEMTAMWLSENQSKPLIPLQKEEDPETHKTVLTNYMFPQHAEDFIPSSDSENFNPALWEEQRKQRAQVAFECDEDKDERETPPREGHLKRYPTPYPDELKNMVKTAQSVAHRLKEDETSDESGKESKPVERNHIGVQDVGVKVIEGPFPNGVASDIDAPVSSTCPQSSSATESRETSEPFSSQNIPLKSSEGSMMNHEDTLEDTEELSEEEEMKIAEMRPPLIEISINQPKVVTLSKDKKDDADSLLDDTVANSNQNNSNCSSPSRMSDSVSLTTDSSQDNSLCTPERESKMPFLPKSRQDDENMNQPKDTTPLLHNGNGSEPLLQTLLKTQQTPPDYDLSMEAYIEKGVTNGMGDAYTKWDQINMNVTKLPPYHAAQFNKLDKVKNGSVNDCNDFQNGNQQGSDCINSLVNRSQGTRAETSASSGVAASSDMSLSRSTEELSPEKRCPLPSQVTKSHSVSNIEAGGMKLYSFDGDDEAAAAAAGRIVPGPGAQGQNIVRSKSASQLLNDQNLLVYPGSLSSSSDLLSSSKPPVSTSRYLGSSSMSMGVPPPQYNIQYASSAVPKDDLWAQRDHQGYLPPHPHSLANTNYSNRNQAPPYTLQPQQRGVPMAPMGDWTKERLHSAGGPPRSSTLQRQGSSASSVSMGDPKRVQAPEGEYMTYRDIHTLARGPLAMSQAMQRPFSARTYSIDAPIASRPVAARPPPHELPERTMSVSDFSYQQSSPSKRPNTRVKSEHSLLDGPGQVSGGMGPGRVPTDWRDQVMRHIEAKKMEKDDVFVPQGPQSYTMDPHRKVPLMNGQMGPSGRPQMSQSSMARHPSREQLIDYLMLKVSQQPHGPPRVPHDTLQQEIRVKVEKNPELGFSISGGVGGRGNPFRPEDNGIFVTRVQPEGPASKILQPGDKIIQANGYSFVNIDHGNAVSLLKMFPTTVDLTIVREVQA